MDGKNSSGRKISLLNDSSDVGPLFAKAQHSLPPLTAQLHSHHQPQSTYFANISHSRASSTASTPSLSPQTPQLVRSDSSESRIFATPSPSTPSSAGHHDHFAYLQPRQQYFLQSQQASRPKMDDLNGSMYPPPDAPISMPSAYPIPAHLTSQIIVPQANQQLYRSSNSPSSEPSRVSTVSTASNNNPRSIAPKKNQYPCPLSKQFGCNDYFTTSGHAARHAKKHTGKKDAFCPECNKAFTRKDNMEQHRRTHQNGRGASRTKAGSSDDSKVKKPTKPTEKKPMVKSEPALEAAVEQQIAEQQQMAEQQLVEQQQQQQQQQHIQAQVQVAQMQNAPQQVQQQTTDPAMMIPVVGNGPYFLNSIDSGPIPPLPMPTMADAGMRPPLHRSNYTTSLDYFPPGQMMGDPEIMNFSYPSPGLSNGLNSLALAASEHRRLSEEKYRSPSDEGSTP